MISPSNMMMTQQQQRLVRDSFDSLGELAQPLALLFYGKLFELDPDARRLFHNDLDVQGHKLMATLGTVLESLDDFEPMRARLADLGRKHAEYGVRAEQYDILATALLWSLGQALGAHFDTPTREAWALTVNELNTAMKAGADPLHQ